MIKCVIFDCDGTLVDSEYLCNLGLEIKLREYGVESSAMEMLEKFRGTRLSTIQEVLESQYKIKLKDDFVSSYRLLVEELFERDLKACEGVSDMLKELLLPKCVASSGPLEKIIKALSIVGILGHFNGNLYSSYDIDSWKPDPDIFLHAAKEMGFKPNECAVVEDSPVGVTAAKSAGMFAVLYDPHEIHKTINGVKRIQHMRHLKNAIT